MSDMYSNERPAQGGGTASLVAILFPFSTAAPVSQKFATATVNLFVGIAIGSLLTAVGARADDSD